ncbi:MAG: nucleotide-binding protein [Thaumarchaeota archaeon]|nr:nucleotide-binding protein [Nitrososphaerota archaeon]
MPGGLGKSSGKEVKVLDSTAIFLGFTEVSNCILATSSKILEEIKYGDGRYRALATREGGLIKVLDPGKEFVREVEKAASDLGESGLSEADVSILALALQLSKEGRKTSIVTSDYSVQNVASKLGIKVEPILHRGIKKTIEWTVYCSVCHWVGKGVPGEPCPRCGHPLKRRPRKIEKN